MKNARIFLTDYASYNNGTQFEFGHWVDLGQFSEESELMEYISNHFKEADKKSPLDNFGSIREEVMITDFEGFPEQFYGESSCDWPKIFAWMELDYDSLTDSEKVERWNEYCDHINSDGHIFPLDDDFLETRLPSDKVEAFQMGQNANINWSDDWAIFNGYGNMESISDPTDQIDEDALINYLIETI